MSASLGRIGARLAEPAEDPAPSGLILKELVDLINQNINPPNPVVASEVLIRAMYIVSDEINSFGGRFPIDEHQRLSTLLIDSPVMVGHRKDKLPIGRNFHAVEVERDGRRWVKTYFYWLQSAEGSDSLRENIDGGIYKECSIGFTYLLPECSICGKDLRSCEHEPLAEYQIDGKPSRCHFNYRKIERVLETSLVYRGAVPNTSVSKDLNDSDENQLQMDRPLDQLRLLDSEAQFLVTPFYNGLPVRISQNPQGIQLCRLDGRPLNQAVVSQFEKNLGEYAGHGIGMVIGYRGKERCDLASLEKYIERSCGPVSRVELKIISPDKVSASQKRRDKRSLVGIMRSDLVPAHNIDSLAKKIATRDGVRIWPVSDGAVQFDCYHYRVDGSGQTVGDYQIRFNHANSQATLTLSQGGHKLNYVLRQFNPHRLNNGARFIADFDAAPAPSGASAGRLSGKVSSISEVDKGLSIKLSGDLSGTFRIRPIRLLGQQRYLFYRAA